MIILKKMKSFVLRQVERMKEKLDEKALFQDDNAGGVLDEENYQEEIMVESDDADDDRNKQAEEESGSNQPETNTINTDDVIVLD